MYCCSVKYTTIPFLTDFLTPFCKIGTVRLGLRFRTLALILALVAPPGTIRSIRTMGGFGKSNVMSLSLAAEQGQRGDGRVEKVAPGSESGASRPSAHRPVSASSGSCKNATHPHNKHRCWGMGRPNPQSRLCSRASIPWHLGQFPCTGTT